MLDAGPVYHILTPRGLPPDGCLVPATLRKLFPATLAAGGAAGPEAGNAHHLLNQILRRTDAFNHDVLAKVGRPPLIVEQEGVAPGATGLDALFARADALAFHYRNRTRQALALLLGLSLAMAFLLQLHFLNGPGHWTAAYVVAFLLAVLCYGWLRRGDFEAKYQDYRALAEGLRVQRYWRLAGVNESASDHYLRRQRGELEWVRQALRSCAGLRRPADAFGSRPAPDLPRVVREWVRGQEEWYGASGRKSQTMDRALTLCKQFLLWSGVGLTLLALLPGVPREVGSVASMIVVGAALLHCYGHSSAFGDEAKHYGQMGRLFGQARRRLLKIEGKDGAATRRLLVELGREALAENGDWLLMRRDRLLELPKPG